MKTDDIATRFVQLSSRHGFRKGFRQLTREYTPDEIAAFATEKRIKPKVSEHGNAPAQPALVAACQQWGSLHTNTATHA